MRIQIDGYETKTQLKAVKKAIDHIINNEDFSDLIGTTPAPTVDPVTPPSTQPDPVVTVDPEPTPTTAIITEPELDASGLPWDARIHASSKLKTNANKWKKRKNVDSATYEAVIAELTCSDVVPAAGGTGDEATGDGIDPATVGFGDKLTWEQVVQKVMNAKVNESVMQAQIDSEASNLGVASFMALVDRPDLWDQFLTSVGIS